MENSVIPTSVQTYEHFIRYEVLIAVQMSLLIIWVLTPCGINILEEHTTLILKAENGSCYVPPKR
jgi:hypothetical protein